MSGVIPICVKFRYTEYPNTGELFAGGPHDKFACVGETTSTVKFVGAPGAVGGGFFNQFISALNTTTTATPTAAAATSQISQGIAGAAALGNSLPGTVFNSDASVNPVLSVLSTPGSLTLPSLTAQQGSDITANL